MNSEKPQLEMLKKYLYLFFDWHKLILLFILLAISVGLAMYLRTPKIYESRASILFQQQRVNPSRLSPDEERQIGEMVATVSQQVMSRSSLERIIKEFGLYTEMRENVPIEDVIKRMRERDISIDVDRGRGNVFSVSYQGHDPEKTVKVTNALASRFIEENLRFREERAAETTRYIKDELRMSKEVLGEKEAEMRDYKLKYYNEMPDQRASNMARLNALQEQYQSIQSRIHDLEQTRLLVSEQIETRRNLQRLTAGAVSEENEGAYGRRDDLSEARRTLQERLSRYTSQHPEVIRAENRVRQLEAEQDALMAERLGTLETEDGIPLVVEDQDPRIHELSVQFREIELNLRALRSDAENIRDQMKRYQGWIEAAPIREAEWSALTRDYDELRTYHDNLLSQSLAAEAAESLEKRQQGSQFKVIDPAYLPTTPVKGTFMKILFMATAAGAVAGLGLVAGLNMLDGSFKEVREVEDYLQVPVTCAIPLIITPAEKTRRMIKNILWALFFGAWLVTLAAAVIYFYLQGDVFI